MEDRPIIAENEMQLRMYIHEDGEISASTAFHLPESISDEAFSFYRRLLEGLLISLATDPDGLVQKSLDADYIEYMRKEEKKQIEEMLKGKEDNKEHSGGAVSLEAFKRMKARGKG